MMDRAVRVIQTAKEQETPWREKEPLKLDGVYSMRMHTVDVDSSKTFQTHMGFGGAFTEASAYTLSETNHKNRKEVVHAYFNKEDGLGYNMGRTTIGGSDFALEPYTYIDEGDDSLDTFNMDREERWVIPFIKNACREAEEPLELLSSPWSPPAFMKDNKDINHGGRLLKKYYHTWAKYMVRYLKEMKDRGIGISMVSVQNEPEAKQTWASCKFDATRESEFAVKYLYPELKKAGMDQSVKIVIWDHNRDLMYQRVKESMAYPKARQTVWGVAHHWYVSEQSEILTMVHEDFPEKHLIFTEGCVELTPKGSDEKQTMGDWSHGETYGRNIIKDFNNYCEGWIDWNMVLNEYGGPNYARNYCEAPVLIDRNTDQVTYNSSYYYIGHFSKYIKPGAKRLLCRSDAREGIWSVAYKNPGGEIVVVIQNQLDCTYPLALVVDKEGVNIELPQHSITTFVIDGEEGRR